MPENRTTLQSNPKSLEGPRKDVRSEELHLHDFQWSWVWVDKRRFWLRPELDAAFFHLYGINLDDVDYIMETFPIVKRKDIAAYGSYRTKEANLGIYNEMAEAME